jgi:uncharacterized protein DUF6491
MKKLILALAAGAVLATPSLAAPSPVGSPAVRGEEARIPFANRRGGIRSFHAEEDDVVYIQDSRRNWYRAELVGPCLGLRWAIRIGVDTRGSSSFDRGSALLVEGDRCQLISLSRSERPPRRPSKRTKAG